MSLTVAAVTAGYGSGRRPDSSREVLSSLSVSVERGECVAVVGPNGAGKSTLVRLMSGQLRPSQGTVTVDGAPVAALSRLELARRVAVVEQNPVLPAGFAAVDVVAMGRTPHLGLFGAPTRDDHDRVARVMEETGTAALRDRLVETLSGGERQRVVLARALAQGTSYLLLDEPTNHLDLRYQLEVMAFARRAASAGSGVVLVLHDLNLAARASDRVAVLAGGRVVVEGPPSDVLTPAVLSEVYGATVRVIDDAGVPVVVPVGANTGGHPRRRQD